MPAGEARLTGVRPGLDPRRWIARPDLVEIALAGQVAAARYVAPLAMQAAAPRVPMRKAGNADSAAVSELLAGEAFDLFESVDGWAYGRSVADAYVGWVHAEALVPRDDRAQVMVTARVAPVFAAADIKAPVVMELPFGARVSGAAGEPFFVCDAGFIHNRHLAPAPATPVEVAQLFTGAPYLWGGRTPLGVDCSGLVQAALMACGTACPRDSDQQRESIGTAVDLGDRRAGDVMFFPGHVGILIDADTLLHANAHWMAVVSEPLADVIARLADSPQPVTGVRRIG
jgi:cell wall-associated NlpC family hydrolase